MKAALVFLAAVAVTAAGAADCPPGCTQTAVKKKPAAKPAVHAAPVPGPTGPQGPKGDKGDKGDPGAIAPVNVVCAPTPCPTQPEVYANVKPHGLNYVDLGPIFSRGWGLQGNGGHIFSSGLKLNIGFNWIPQDPTRGQYGCLPGGGHDSHGGPPGGNCIPTPWEAPAPNPWGGGATIGYAW